MGLLRIRSQGREKPAGVNRRARLHPFSCLARAASRCRLRVLTDRLRRGRLGRRGVQSSWLLVVVCRVIIPLELCQHLRRMRDREDQFAIVGFVFAYLVKGDFCHIHAIAEPVFELAESLAVQCVDIAFRDLALGCRKCDDVVVS